MNITNQTCFSNCNLLFKMTSSCPTNKINFNENFSLNDFYEALMVFLSIAPYPTGILIIIYTLYNKTSRSLFVCGLLLCQVNKN